MLALKSNANNNILLELIKIKKEENDKNPNGIDSIDYIDKNDNTCLSYALLNNKDKNIILNIIDITHDFNYKNKKGDTYLSIALTKNHIYDVIFKITEKTTNLTYTDINGNNYLHLYLQNFGKIGYICYRENDDDYKMMNRNYFNYLINNNLSDQKNKKGDTPLMFYLKNPKCYFPKRIKKNKNEMFDGIFLTDNGLKYLINDVKKWNILDKNKNSYADLAIKYSNNTKRLESAKKITVESPLRL